MTIEQLTRLTQGIVARALSLNAAHTSESNVPVNYACIFAQSMAEYEELTVTAAQIGPVIDDTATGPVYKISPLKTDAGMLSLLKVRKPDPKRRERGDADFTVRDFHAFKARHLGQPGFALITRPHMEMLELADPNFDVLAYYSHPTLAEVLSSRS